VAEEKKNVLATALGKLSMANKKDNSKIIINDVIKYKVLLS
jgi:hypothetical protein